MFLYKDILSNDFLIKTGADRYAMKLNGHACGGFNADSDGDALAIFKNILTGEK